MAANKIVAVGEVSGVSGGDQRSDRFQYSGTAEASDLEGKETALAIGKGETAETGGPPSKRPIQCELCSLRLSNRQTYLKHLGRRHPEKQLDQLCSAVKKWYACEETGCDIKTRSREELLHHLGKDHEWEIKEVTGTFDTEDDFEIFFQRVQKMYKTRFVSRHGKVNGVKRFYCNREGAVRVKVEDRSRKHIRRGTSKIGTFCTAHAIVSYHTTGQVSIIGSVTHYNHELEGKYLPLLDSEKNFIRYHAQMGMNCREILEILHKTVGELDEDDPLRYVDYKTIRNTLERGKTLEQNRQSEYSEATNQGNIRMLTKINAYPREALHTKPTRDSKSANEERTSTTYSDIVLEHTAATNGCFDIVQTDTHQWGVKRPEGKVRHKVVRIADVCPLEARNGGTHCGLTCKLCQCCAHLFKCNCGGATKIGKMCKHIHAVVQCIRDCELQLEQDTHGKAATDTTLDSEMAANEYPVAQEVEEEHGLVDSYIADTGPDTEAAAGLKQAVETIEAVEGTAEYATLQDANGANTITADTTASCTVMTIIQESHSGEMVVATDGIRQRPDTVTGDDAGNVFATYEVLPDGSVIGASVLNETEAKRMKYQAVAGEQRINPEFELFLERFTGLLKQLHQVSNPENILQACTVLQQLKKLFLATEPPKLVKY